MEVRKTHLMQAIGNKYKKSHPNARRQIRDEWRVYEWNDRFGLDQKHRKNSARYRNVDILIVRWRKEATQEESSSTFNALFINQNKSY